MYKIEKFLLDHNFKKIKKYISGVIVYSDAEQEYEYETGQDNTLHRVAIDISTGESGAEITGVSEVSVEKTSD